LLHKKIIFLKYFIAATGKIPVLLELFVLLPAAEPVS